ncbi:MAG: type II secretion system secretin GspD, partial [Desulfobacterales bacterium]|nr:type II secretion system secretin GspD [Desulfobacterales bacterium]
LIPLRYADATQIKRLFAPLVSKSSVVLAYPQTNMLIITDIYSNIQRLMRILSAIDVTGIGQEISVIPLESADAAKLVKILDTVFKAKKRPKKGDISLTIKFVADERTNSVVLFASELDTFRVKKLINLLDKKIPRGKEKIHVYYLENAVAEELAKVLQMLPSKKTITAKGKKVAPVVSGETKITADKATNSLIIMADKDDYLTLEEVIKKLDIPRSMVYIECLLMEVKVSKGLGLGVEWMANNELGEEEGAYGGGFVPSSGSSLSTMVSGAVASGGIVSYPPGFTMGVMGKTITADIGGQSLIFPSLTSFITALKNDKSTHILSTPQIITTDNQEAKIYVGSNTPFITKIGESDTSGLYSNYEYKDVGITLKVTPQISKDRLVRLTINQEITSIDQAATQALGMDKPATLKRTIDTTVIVHDSHTVVIGGLIGNQFSRSESKVPFFGDIPFLGWVFKSMSKGTDKTNLYFFLTPHVVGSPLEAEEKYRQKKAEIEGIMNEEKVKEGKVKMYKWFKAKPETISTGAIEEMPEKPESPPEAPSIKPEEAEQVSEELNLVPEEAGTSPEEAEASPEEAEAQ